MSSSQQTTNLGLPIYGDSDVPNWKDTNTPFQSLDDIIGQGGTGGGSQIQLDFAHPLHVFTQTNNTYTATKTCWLFGSFIASDNAYGYVTVDGTRVAGTYDANIGFPPAFIPPIRIESGSVITVTNLGPDTYQGRQCLAVYTGSVVSSEVTVFNEAEVELNYTTPLFTFDATHLTYTATKTCWLCGNIDTNSGVNHMSINGHPVAFGNNTTQWFSYIPPLKLSRGDVVTFTYNPVMMSVYEGTISGSVGSIGEPVFDFANPLFTFQNNATHKSYTADHDCWLVGYLSLSQLGNCDLSIDGTLIAHARYNNESTGVEIKYKILSGSTVTIQPTATMWETLHIFDEV